MRTSVRACRTWTCLSLGDTDSTVLPVVPHLARLICVTVVRGLLSAAPQLVLRVSLWGVQPCVLPPPLDPLDRILFGILLCRERGYVRPFPVTSISHGLLYLVQSHILRPVLADLVLVHSSSCCIPDADISPPPPPNTHTALCSVENPGLRNVLTPFKAGSRSDRM